MAWTQTSSLMCPSDLSRNDVIRAVKELKNEIIIDSDAIRADATIADMVVEWSLQNRVAGKPVVSPPKPMGSSIGTIRKMISARLQLEWADRTGKVDYAALYNGAEIFTNVENSTTSSLLDKLPILNRIFCQTWSTILWTRLRGSAFTNVSCRIAWTMLGCRKGRGDRGFGFCWELCDDLASTRQAYLCKKCVD
jgi:hypothetical protein